MKWRIGVVVLLTGGHFIFRGLGFGAHTSVIAGMPQSEASWLLGPVYVLSWLALLVVVPPLAMATLLKSLMDLTKYKSDMK